MRSLFSTTALLVPFLAAQAARAVVFRDQVGQVDFHYELVGLPQEQTTFFHQPRQEDKANLLYTLSDAGMLAAVNPSSGALVWRQPLAEEEDNDPKQAEPIAKTGHVRAVDGEGWLASGLGRSVYAWNALSGRAVWRADFAGEVASLDIVPSPTDEAGGDMAARKDVLALSYEERDGAQSSTATVLRRLRGNDGHVAWEYRDVHLSRPLHVSATADKAFIVSLHGSSQLKVLVVDVQTGHRQEEHTLATDLHGPKDVIFVGGSSTSPIVVWTDSSFSKIRINALGTKRKDEFGLPEGTTEVLVHALPQSQASSFLPLHFLLHTRTAKSHGAQVFHVDSKTLAVQKAYTLPPAHGAGAFAVSTNLNRDTIYYTRITDEEISLSDSAPHHGTLGSWRIHHPASHDSKKRIRPAGAAAAEVVVKPSGDSYAVRVAVLTKDEDWVLVLNGQLAWSRPEGLTGAVAAAFAEQPESEQLVKALEQEAHSNPLAAYVHRVKRHFDDLENLPSYLQAVPRRLISSIFGTADSAASFSSPAITGKAGKADSFGFHKLAILATRRGRLYGLDAASPGTIQWNTKAVDLEPGATWAVKNIHVDEVQGVATVFGQTPGQTVTVEIESGKRTESSLFSVSQASVDTEIESTVLVNSEAGPWVLTIPKDGQIGQIPLERCPKELIVVHTPTGGIQGIRFAQKAGECIEETTWTFAPPPNFRIANVATRPAHDPIASIGRVLGDRRVLYKYLNPNLVVAAAIDDDAAVLTTFLLDTVSGQVLSSSTYGGVDGRKPVECLLFENTFLCTYFADSQVHGIPDGGDETQAIKGYHVTVSDLYESYEPNNRGIWDSASDTGIGKKSGTAQTNVSAVQPLDVVVEQTEGSDSALLLLPAVWSQTWVVAEKLTSLAVTQTRQGITVRQVLAYLPRVHGIVGLPRIGAVLDARRPVGRDPTPAEVEEGLARYAPNLEIDPRLVVTHERDVVGVRHIVASPTHVESTSLVLAFGDVDVFGTRVAPSFVFDLLDKGFGKLSMLATVFALVVGVAVLRPMVAKKQINLRWRALL